MCSFIFATQLTAKIRASGVQIVARGRKIPRAKEREQTRGDWEEMRGNACAHFSKEADPSSLHRRQWLGNMNQILLVAVYSCQSKPW